MCIRDSTSGASKVDLSQLVESGAEFQRVISCYTSTSCPSSSSSASSATLSRSSSTSARRDSIDRAPVSTWPSFSQLRQSLPPQLQPLRPDLQPPPPPPPPEAVRLPPHSSSSLRRQSSSLYLAFLAAVDNISLVFILAVWFGWIGVHIFHKNGWCQTIMYCTYVCSFLSAWTVVSVVSGGATVVDGGQFHGGAVDRRVSPAAASPAVHTSTCRHGDGPADRHLSGVLLILSLHHQRQILPRSARLRHPREVQRAVTG